MTSFFDQLREINRLDPKAWHTEAEELEVGKTPLKRKKQSKKVKDLKTSLKEKLQS